MPTIVDFPTVVKDALDVFGDLFANEPERRHFAEYLNIVTTMPKMGARKSNISLSLSGEAHITYRLVPLDSSSVDSANSFTR